MGWITFTNYQPIDTSQIIAQVSLMDRRTFLKAAGLGSVSFAYGCNRTQDKNLFSLVIAPEDMVTGKASWYASTCAECPAGCGVLAKNREGRVIKLEGNPLHPINRGKLCIRGQSALQDIYDPDRLTTPKLKKDGAFEDISYDDAFELLSAKISEAVEKGTNRIKMVTGSVGDPLSRLFETCLKEWRSGAPIHYEAFSYDSLRAAHQALFGKGILPSYKIDDADFILGFGADFLETWLSPVEYAGKFKAMHGTDDNQKGMFVHIGPFMSLTAANADSFISVSPGNEVMIALGIMRELLQKVSTAHLPRGMVGRLQSITGTYTFSRIEEQTGVATTKLESITKRLQQAKKPLVLGGSSPTESSFALELSTALINLLLDKDLALYNFAERHGVEKVARGNEMDAFLKNVQGQTSVLLLFKTNPLYTLPGNEHLKNIFADKKIFKVSFSSSLDESSQESDLVFPVRLPLETWDAYSGKTGLISTSQPAMGKLTHSPQIGDIFIELVEALHSFENYQHYLMDTLFPAKEKNTIKLWLKMIQTGGNFDEQLTAGAVPFTVNPGAADVLSNALTSLTSNNESLSFLAVPSLKYFDGRGANKPWLNEIPDPVTSIAWESMAMVHPETLKKNGLRQGDVMEIQAGNSTLQAPAYSFTGVHQNLVVMPIGLGHEVYGRFAEGNGSNPLKLINNGRTPNSDGMFYSVPLTGLKKAGRVRKLPKTDGSRSQYKRKIAVSLSADQKGDKHPKKEGLTMNDFPLTLPIEEGYDKKRDVYKPHPHEGYRWGMVIDLDRCIGCSACVAACYAENNVAVVGKEQLANGREMTWLRIERYEDKNDKEKLIFLPMLCQHCDNAPCEAVCPVYAPYHGKEGLNNQIYNRCVGTRFCAQNCPYKVRRFNWFDWKFDEPLNLQLNPNVTVRSKGVMEKCSFCVQRIKEAHGHAKNENRKIRDGEVKPACVQTCPTNAITFGSFEDKTSKVYQMAKGPRAYQVLGYLNTKSAVIYLKKIIKGI